MKDNRGTRKFAARIFESDKAVCAVAYMLRLKGCTVVLPPVANPRERTPDEGDMTVITPKGETYNAEVKGMDIEFSSRATFPHPKIIVDACYHYDKLDPKPKFYFICNKSLSLALIMPTSKQSQWEKFLGGHTDPGMEGDRYYYRAYQNLWTEQTLDPWEITGIGFFPEEDE